jgi:hypothetical protein
VFSMHYLSLNLSKGEKIRRGGMESPRYCLTKKVESMFEEDFLAGMAMQYYGNISVEKFGKFQNFTYLCSKYS